MKKKHRGFLPAPCCGLALLVLAAFASAPANAHEAGAYHYIFINNKYAGDNPGGESMELRGAVPQAKSLEGVSAYTSNDNGGTVSVDAAVGQVDPFSLTWLSVAGASTNMSYNFWVDGPDPDALVPVRFQAFGSVSSNNHRAGGELALRLLNRDTSDQLASWNVAGSLHPQDDSGISQVVASLNIDQVFFFKPSYTYVVELIAEAGAQTVPKGARASAMLDPVFTIRDDFASAYRMVGVPGNVSSPPVSAVPEPTSWVMMISGFGLLGAWLRRRTRVVACSETQSI